jgi:two-component system, LuxR family, response regulator FixJ
VILLVDDNEVQLDTQANLLEYKGYATRRAKNGYEALAMIRERVPKVLILDLRMPGLDGEQVLAKLHAEHLTPPHVVITTAKPVHELPTLPCAANVLQKPFEPATLLDLLKSLTEPKVS